jgi:hypothetical protein
LKFQISNISGVHIALPNRTVINGSDMKYAFSGNGPWKMTPTWINKVP